jgi:hypothetical protein
MFGFSIISLKDHGLGGSGLELSAVIDPSACFKTTSFFIFLQSLEGDLLFRLPCQKISISSRSQRAFWRGAGKSRDVLPGNHQHRTTERRELVSESRGRFSSNFHRRHKSHSRPLLTGGCDYSTCPYMSLGFIQELIGFNRSTSTQTAKHKDPPYPRTPIEQHSFPPECGL